MTKENGKHGATCSDNCCQQLNMLQTSRPVALNSIGEDGWEEIEMVVDSGASETVVGEDMVMTTRGERESIPSQWRHPHIGRAHGGHISHVFTLCNL